MSNSHLVKETLGVYVFLVFQGIPRLRLGLILRGTVGYQRWGPLPRKFVASTRARTRDHLLKRSKSLPLRPTFSCSLYFVVSFNFQLPRKCISMTKQNKVHSHIPLHPQKPFRMLQNSLNQTQPRQLMTWCSQFT